MTEHWTPPYMFQGLYDEERKNPKQHRVYHPLDGSPYEYHVDDHELWCLVGAAKTGCGVWTMGLECKTPMHLKGELPRPWPPSVAEELEAPEKVAVPEG